MDQKKFKILLSASFLVFFIFPPASTYLDPGFANMVWQLIAAVAFGIAFTLKIYWVKIKNFFSKAKNG